MEFSEWTPPEIAHVVDVSGPGVLPHLISYYEGTRRTVVEEVMGLAYDLGAHTAIVEYRYLDPDFRSEHSRFYSRTFRRYPSVTHRVHFFAESPDKRLGNAELPETFEGIPYLGYTVLRPLPGARVGRTMLPPQRELSPYVMCQAVDRVNVFGETMTVRGTPFMSQDAQLGVCAHMTLWVASYYHYLAYGHTRYLPSDIAEAVPADIGMGRQSPSNGLNVWQIGAGSTALGRPALVYRCDNLPKREPSPSARRESIPSIACRYLNSGMPVIVAAGSRHAFVLVGYKRTDPGSPDERIRFICQDDGRGPYQVVDDFNHDRHGPWDFLIVPLPEKVFVPGEKAEAIGRVRLLEAMRRSSHPDSRDLVDRSVLPKDDEQSVSFRSTVMRSNRFKETLDQRGVPSDVATLYRRMQLSRWVWVVEIVLRKARSDGSKAVLGEAIVDATDHGNDLQILAMRIPGELWSWRPDEDLAASREIGSQDPYDSVSRFVLDPPLPAQPT
jgi:hypothetical protein